MVLSSCLCGKAQLEIVSYYISKEHPEARFSWLVEGEYKEFDPKAKALEMPRLAKAPFTSRFFKEGDQLFDVSSFFDSTLVSWTSGFQAVLNKTTGRLVINGGAGQHHLMEYLFVNGVVPIKVHSTFDLYVFPPAKGLIEAWSSETLPKGWKRLKTLSGVAGSGRNVLLKDDLGELTIETESFAGSSESIIGVRWWFGGKLQIEGEKVEIFGHRGDVALSGVSRLHDLGSFGKAGKRLSLVKKIEVKHEDGTSMDDFILREIPGLPYHFKNTRDYFERFDYSLPEEGKGKNIRKWPVPPTFEAFLTDGEPDQLDSEEKEPLQKQLRKLGRGVDLKRLLAKQGVDFEAEDTAFLFPDGGVLIVQADPQALELVDSICLSAGQSVPPNARIFAALMEYAEEPKEATFPIADGRILAQWAVIGTPGRGFDLKSKSKGLKMDIEIEPQFGGLDRGIVEVRWNGKFKLDGEEEMMVRSSVSVKSGEAIIVSKFRHKEIWRAVILRAEQRSVYDEIPE